MSIPQDAVRSIGQPEAADRTVACFGCSFTYGVAVAAEETFCFAPAKAPAGLACREPWRLQLRDRAKPAVSTAIFAMETERTTWHSAGSRSNQIRNVVDITWVQNKSRLLPAGMGGAMRNFPRAALDEAGKTRLAIEHGARVPTCHEADWTDFSTEPFYRDLVCFQAFRSGQCACAEP